MQCRRYTILPARSSNIFAAVSGAALLYTDCLLYELYFPSFSVASFSVSSFFSFLIFWRVLPPPPVRVL